MDNFLPLRPQRPDVVPPFGVLLVLNYIPALHDQVALDSIYTFGIATVSCQKWSTTPPTFATLSELNQVRMWSFARGSDSDNFFADLKRSLCQMSGALC